MRGRTQLTINDLGQFARGRVRKLAETGYGGGHFMETAIVMSYDESLVAKDKYDAEDGLSNHRTII